MNRKCILVLFALCIGFSSTWAQQTDFSGTWILNLEKSKLESKPEGLTGSMFVIEQKNDKVYLTRYHIYGEKKDKISFKMTPDGKTRTIKLFFKGKLEKSTNGLKASIWNNSFSNIVNYQFGINQNELIADEVFTSSPDTHHNIWVFDRVSPEGRN